MVDPTVQTALNFPVSELSSWLLFTKFKFVGFSSLPTSPSGVGGSRTHNMRVSWIDVETGMGSEGVEPSNACRNLLVGSELPEYRYRFEEHLKYGGGPHGPYSP